MIPELLIFRIRTALASHFRSQTMRLFRWLQAGRRKPFLHMGCGFSLPGSSDKSLAFDSWMSTLRLFPEALRFFD